MVVSQVGLSETDLRLPTGWKFKTIVGAGSRGRKIVYYESPSGYLYRSPESVLSHMRTSGQYAKEQISKFQQEVKDLDYRKNCDIGLPLKRKSDNDDTLAHERKKVTKISEIQSALLGFSELKKVDT